MEPTTTFQNSNLTSRLEYSEDDMKNVWSVLLHEMETNYYKSGNQPALFSFFAQHIDFNDDTEEEKGSFSYFLEDLIQNYQENDWDKAPAQHWNDTWAAALDNFIKGVYYIIADNDSNIEDIDYEDSGELYLTEDGDIINVKDIRGGLGTSGVSFRYKDVRYADAGANFVISISEKVETEKYGTCYKLVAPWVIPWYNINGDSYATVRGIDKCIAALSSSDELDFTVKAQDMDKDKIRLILPRNTRNVEVEDLNRNFWVIAQTVSAMSAYLFDEDGPIPKSFKDLIGALTDIWENVEYLWAAVAALGQKPYITDIKTLVIPINASELQPYIKYDNFDGFNDPEIFEEYDNAEIFNGYHEGKVRELCVKKLSYLLDSYEDCHLVVLPEIRLNNYEKNYYSKVYYPGIMKLDRNISPLTWVWDYVDADNTMFYSLDLTAETEDKNFVYVLRENSEETYGYFAPASDPPQEDIDHRYYELLRPSYEIISTYENDQINLTSSLIEFYDVAKELITGTKTKVWSNGTWETIEAPAGGTIEEIPIEKGYYQGELLSCPISSNAIEWDIGSTSYNLEPQDAQFGNLNKNQLQRDSINVLQEILNVRYGDGNPDIDLPKIEDNAFHLFTGSHLYAADPLDQPAEGHVEHLYYDITQQDGFDRYRKYCLFSNSVDCGAIMHNPKSRENELYKEYWTYTNYVAYGINLLRSKKVEIFLKKGSYRVEADNWLIKVSEVMGSSIYSKDPKKWGDLPIDWEPYSYEYDTAFDNRATNERIFISYFMPNSRYAMKSLERTVLSTSEIGAFPNEWTYVNIPPNMDDYSLITNSVQRGGVWLVQNGATYADYEKYPNKGF